MKRPTNRRSAGLSLADLLVVVVLIPLSLIAFIGCYQHTHEGGGRVKCASNLKVIGNALLLYANENKQSFPRTTYRPGEVVVPVWGTGAAASNPFAADGPQPNDVTAALFLLVRTQDVSSEVFICPSSDAERWDFGGGANTAMNWSNWEGRDGILKHLTYSFQNPYPDNAAVARGFTWNASLGSGFAVMADMNPGLAGANQNVLAVKPDSPPAQMKQANSLNHNGDGQNVLYADGHVSFELTPFAGVNADNIYARRAGPDGSASSEVRNSPFDGKDSVLLPSDD